MASRSRTASAVLVRLVRVATLLVAILSTCVAGVRAQPIVRVDGKTLVVHTMARHGFVFVPIRGVFERLHASVRYRAPGTVSIAKGGREIVRMHMGSHRTLVNGRPTWSPAAPFRSHGHIYVPLRLIGQAAGAVVVYQSQLIEIRNRAPRAILPRARHRHIVVHRAAVVPLAVVAPQAAVVPQAIAQAPVVAESGGSPAWPWFALVFVLLAAGAAYLAYRYVLRSRDPEDPVIRTRAPIEVGTPTSRP